MAQQRGDQRRPRRVQGSFDSGVQVRMGPRTSGAHLRRAGRRRPETRGLVVVGAAVAAVVIAAVALYVVRGSVGSSSPRHSADLSTSGLGPVTVQKQGPAVQVSTADGDTYAMRAVDGGGDSVGPSPAPGGQTYAYIDYVLTNTLDRPVLLNLPADLFVQRSLVPVSYAPRCQAQTGVPDDMCALPDTSKIVGIVSGGAPTKQNGDNYLPAHASYLIRVTTSFTVSSTVSRADLGLYVWNAVYVPDQQARLIAFP